MFKDFADKISSYNLLNFLLPGVVFAYLAQNLLGWPAIDENLIVAFFFYYLYGAVLSRIGSIVVEPLMPVLKMRAFDHRAYTEAKKIEPDAAIYLETANMYRTFAAMFVVLLAGLILKSADVALPLDAPWFQIAGMAVLAGLFILSYRKQSNYVGKTIDTALGREPDERTAQRAQATGYASRTEVYLRPRR